MDENESNVIPLSVMRFRKILLHAIGEGYNIYVTGAKSHSMLRVDYVQDDHDEDYLAIDTYVFGTGFGDGAHGYHWGGEGNSLGVSRDSKLSFDSIQELCIESVKSDQFWGSQDIGQIRLLWGGEYRYIMFAKPESAFRWNFDRSFLNAGIIALGVPNDGSDMTMETVDGFGVKHSSAALSFTIDDEYFRSYLNLVEETDETRIAEGYLLKDSDLKFICGRKFDKSKPNAVRRLQLFNRKGYTEALVADMVEHFTNNELLKNMLALFKSHPEEFTNICEKPNLINFIANARHKESGKTVLEVWQDDFWNFLSRGTVEKKKELSEMSMSDRLEEELQTKSDPWYVKLAQVPIEEP